MSHWFSQLVVCCALCASLAGGDGTSRGAAHADESASIESIVLEQLSRLDSPLRAERMEAEEQIRQLGPAALAFLPASDEIEQDHVREVVDRLRVELERAAAEQSLQPTMVSLTGIATVGDWAALIAEQTRYSVEFDDETLADARLAADPPPDGPITFWQAVDFVEEHAAIAVERTDEGGILISAREGDAEAWLHDSRGTIRVSVTPLREQENLIDPMVNARVRTDVRIDVEPKLAGLFIHWTPADLYGSVEGIDLTPVGAEGRRELPIPASQRVEFPVDFTLPWNTWNERPADADFNLSGTLQVTVATGFTDFEFRHLDEPGEIVRRRGGMAAMLESFERSQDRAGSIVWQADLVIDYGSRPLELDSYQLWALSRAVSLVRENGAMLLPAADRQVSPLQGGTVRLHFLFEDPLDDLATATLIYQAPTIITENPVTFEIAPDGGAQEVNAP